MGYTQPPELVSLRGISGISLLTSVKLYVLRDICTNRLLSNKGRKIGCIAHFLLKKIIDQIDTVKKDVVHIKYLSIGSVASKFHCFEALL